MTMAQSPIVMAHAGIMSQSSQEMGFWLMRCDRKRSPRQAEHKMAKVTAQTMTLPPL